MWDKERRVEKDLILPALLRNTELKKRIESECRWGHSEEEGHLPSRQQPESGDQEKGQPINTKSYCL